MTAARIATYASIGAVLAWAVKAVAIGMAGGLDRSPAEGPLFILGFVLFVVGVVAMGPAVGAGHGLPGRLLAVVGVLVVGFVVWLAIDTVIAAMAPERDPHWVWAEAQLWVIAVATAVGWQLWLRRGTGASESAAT